MARPRQGAPCLYGIIVVTFAAKFRLHTASPLRLEFLEERRQAEQIPRAEVRASARDSHKRVRLLDVRPTGRQMPKQALFVVEVDPGLSPSMAGRLQTVRTPAQGMERVGHPQDYTLMFPISSS